jgi:drug/metabolite transporter (DMT)-like permease
MLLIGIYIFKEKHNLLEYFGAILIIIACVTITLQKDVGGSETTNDSASFDFYMSIVLTLLCSISWALVGFMAKWA